MTAQKFHVIFDNIDLQEEEERSQRGRAHRKDLVRGIKLQKADDEKIKDAQTEYGYSWLRDEERSLESIEKLDLGVKLVLHGFLVFFHEATRTDDSDVLENLPALFEYFVKHPIPLDELSKKLKEHLALLSFVVVDNEYGIPIVE